MSFVLRNDQGKFLKNRNAWGYEFVEDLQHARTYVSKGAANNSKNQACKYLREKIPMEIVEVRLIEVN